MVVLLKESEIDPLSQEMDTIMTAAEEEEANRRFAPTTNPGDLSNGGMVGGARITPRSGWGGQELAQGRPAARRAWMWNGTESLLPLAWNPDGNQHDNAMRYLRKRHCLCCHTGGFILSARLRGCPNCIKSNCDQCRGGTDTTTVQTLASGKSIKGWIIPNFYLFKKDVPFPGNFYGSIPCFLEFCPRRGTKGFLSEQAMRVHASTRHRMEYQAHVETLAASRTDELDRLRQRLDALQGSQVQTRTQETASERATRAWETRRKNERLKTKPEMA